MDNLFINQISRLSFTDLENLGGKVKDYVIKPKELGGIGLLLPGEYYKEMKQLQNKYLNPDKNSLYPVEDYFKKLRKFSLEEKYKGLYEKTRNSIKEESAIPKVGYSLDSYKQLSSREFIFLMQTGIGLDEKSPRQNEFVRCDKCLHWIEKTKE